MESCPSGGYILRWIVAEGFRADTPWLRLHIDRDAAQMKGVAVGDIVSALAAPLDDPTVGVTGLRGLASHDLVRFEPAPDGTTAAVAVDLAGLAFRRGDYAARGPLDEQFTYAAYLDAWWSLVLRDVPEDAVFGVDVPRRALVVATPFRLEGDPTTVPNERLGKKHRYRYLKWFATRRDLLVDPEE